MKDPIVGIDLGTSNTVVAYADATGVPHVLADSGSFKIHPSVVSFHPNGGVVVGAPAKQRKVIDPKNTIYSVKRLIGRAYDSPEVQVARKRMPYVIKEGSNKLPLIATRGGDFAVAEISAIILDHAKQAASSALQTDVSRAVVTVPASFNDAQRSATATSGSIAGITVVRVLNEPTAAALAYGNTRNLKETIAVYDFGGGTFDITILKLEDQVYEVLGTAGDSFLGGDDLDERIVDRMVDKFLAENRVDLRTNEVSMMRLRAVAEQTKIELSRRSRALVRVDEIAYGPRGKPIDLQIEIRRDEFVSQVADIIDKTFPVCAQALELAGLAASAVDDVILVGGTTKIPHVRDQVAKFFGKAPRTDVNPEDAVAVGAALQANALERLLRRAKQPSTVHDAVPEPIGESASQPYDPPSQPVPAPIADSAFDDGFSGETTAYDPDRGQPQTPARRAGERAVQRGQHHDRVDLSAPPAGPALGRMAKQAPDASKTILSGPPPALPSSRDASKTILSGPPSTVAAGAPAVAPIGTPSVAGVASLAQPPQPAARVAPSAPGSGASAAPPRTPPASPPRTPPATPARTAPAAPARTAPAAPAPAARASETPPSSLRAAGMGSPPAPAADSPRGTTVPATGASTRTLVGTEAPLASEATQIAALPQQPTQIAPAPVATTQPLPSTPRAPAPRTAKGMPAATLPDMPAAPVDDLHLDLDGTDWSVDLQAAADEAAAELGAPDSGHLETHPRGFEPPPNDLHLDLADDFDFPDPPTQRVDEEFPNPATTRGIGGTPHAPARPSVPSAAAPAHAAAPTLHAAAPTPPAPPAPAAPSHDHDILAAQAAARAAAANAAAARAAVAGSTPLTEAWGAPPAPAWAQTAAAAAAANVTPLRAPAAPVILDVTPRGLGIGTLGGFCEELIRRNSRLPAEHRKLFVTSRDDQEVVRITVVQGESRRLTNNTVISELRLEGLPRRPRGETSIEVTFTIDASGILQVRARDVQTGREQRAALDIVGSIAQEDVTASRERLQALRR